MSRIVVAYAATLVAFCVIDFVWLGYVAAGFYRTALGPLLLETPNWYAAATFYLMYAAGILIFCVFPALARGSWKKALGFGALFGLFAYGTYDLSNLATLKGWSATVALVDIAWGMAITGICALAGYRAAVKVGR